VSILIAILGQHYAANHEKQHRADFTARADIQDDTGQKQNRDAEPQYFRAVNPDGLLISAILSISIMIPRWNWFSC